MSMTAGIEAQETILRAETWDPHRDRAGTRQSFGSQEILLPLASIHIHTLARHDMNHGTKQPSKQGFQLLNQRKGTFRRAIEQKKAFFFVVIGSPLKAVAVASTEV